MNRLHKLRVLNAAMGRALNSPLSTTVPLPPAFTAADFAIAAAKILNRNSPGSRASVTDGTGLATITVYNTASTINGLSLSGGGEVDEATVPYGCSGAIRGEWIITSPQDPIDDPVHLNFANGMSHLFIYEGQKFEFKGGILTAGSFAVRWSDDGGTTWYQLYQPDSNDQNWYQVDFGSVATRIVEVIGCDQTLAINGYNFDTGSTPPAAYVDAELPMVTIFGDSYAFGQNADTLDNTTGGGTNPNDQNAIYGQARRLGEYLGCLQVRNHGLRGNRFSPGQATRSNYADRISGGVYPAAAEALYNGDSGTATRDLFVIPSTVNDDTGSPNPERRPAIAEAFRRLRELQPNCMILFPVGARAPHWNESDHWLGDNKNGFMDTFGATEAEWIANGAYLLDGSRRDGANWTPSGAEGSLPTFGGVGFDTGHPTQTGYDLLAQKYSDGAIYAAREIVKKAVTEGFGTELFYDNWTSISLNWVDNGDLTYSADGTDTGSLSLNIPEFETGKAYVIGLTVDVTAGELRVRLAGGAYQAVTVSGDYQFVLDDRTFAGLIVQGLTSFIGTVSNVSVRSLI